MFCRNCGNEIEDGGSFCSYCGARLEIEKENPKTENTGKKKGIAMIIIVAICIVIAIITVAALLGKKESSDGSPGKESGESGENDEYGEAQDEEKFMQSSPLYETIDLPVIDLSVQNHTPAAKEAGMEWDNTLFYWLEDTDTLTNTDDYISRCVLSKKMFRNAENGNQIQYEIYSDPDSGEIYKIVSIEAEDGKYKLTDFYYQGGKPNFMFERYDSVYTPTYATIDKTGERFYFNNDVMVKWRIIREPGEIGEYTLAPDDPWYSQSDYFTESEELRQIYDEVEIKRLNQAYNTYEAVVNERSVGIVEGVLTDTAGKPQADVRIAVYRSTDDILLYQTTTDASGAFSIYVYLDGEEGYLHIDESEKFKELTAYGLDLKDSALIHPFTLVLHKISGDEYPVTLYAYPAAEIRTEEGQTAGEPIRRVTALIREGSRAYTGNVIATVSSGEDGRILADLTSGTYTVQILAEGYTDTFLEIEVTEQKIEKAAYMVEGIGKDQTAVVMTWDGADTDLDLTVFTPYQSTGGDMAHIGGTNRSDNYGNLLVADNNSACEVVFINSGERGSYKLYVNDYTDSASGNFSSDRLMQVNVHIYIYNSNGFVADYTIPAGQMGVVWEVAEINGTVVTPGQRVYKGLKDKIWWIENKEKPDWNEVQMAYLEYLEGVRAFDAWETAEAEYIYNDFSLDYIDGDDIPELIYGQVQYDAGGDGFHVLYYSDDVAGAQKIKELSVDCIRSTDYGYEQGDDIDGVTYIEGTGLINIDSGVFGSTDSREHIYQIVNGEFMHLQHGEYNEGYNEGYLYWWNNKKVTEEEYKEKRRTVYGGKGESTGMKHNYTPGEIKEILRTPRTPEELKTFLGQDPYEYYIDRFWQ